jgi:murein DD-endopeptidase MepM/ murein hydrolase activator NlpD
VPKPPNAGTPRSAIAITRGGFVNLRQGPGSRYRDIGDILKNTIVDYFSATRTSDGWIWVEQFGRAGWISNNVVSFDDIDATPQPPPERATPYDGTVAIWHWRGDSISENSIEEVCQTIKQYAPNAKAVFVKTSDWTPSTGAQWMGYWDSKKSLSIDGPSSIDKWVNTLARFDLEFHAWCIPRGGSLAAETSLIIQACQRPGVKSMILDVEPYEGFWIGGRDGVRPFMTRIRQAIPGNFHIGLSVDPRPQHYDSIYPQEWFPFVNSVHPQTYWQTFRDSPEEALQSVYDTWGNYGKPIIPVLQGDASVNSMREAHTLATQRHKAPGLSWWRLGVIGPAEFDAVNLPVEGGTSPPSPPPGGGFDDVQVVSPMDPNFFIFSYTGQQEVVSFQGLWGWSVYYKHTEPQRSSVAARWTPVFRSSARYEVAAFIPARHATTRNARYKIHGVKNSSGEIVVSVNQQSVSDGWVTLGVYEFDANAINSGTVFLNDLTGEDQYEIAFDAVRWRRVVPGGGNGSGSVPLADGFDSPVGTEAERRGNEVWPGQWLDASPFGRLYFIGTSAEAYHTGADLNLPSDRDRQAPLYSVASGEVTFAAELPTWGNVIIIRHDPLIAGGVQMYSRSAHLHRMDVSVGQRVSRGQQIGLIGNAFGRFAYHLHFDLSPTEVLYTNPEDWPAKDRDRLFTHYVDPRIYIDTHRP